MRYRWLIAFLICIAIFSLIYINYSFINKKPVEDFEKAGISNETSEIINKSKFSVSKIEAKEIAEWKFKQSLQENDPVFQPWNQSAIGEPILLRTVEEEPAYWIVPLIFKEKVIGAIYVDGNKSFPRYGVFGGTPDNMSEFPSVITFSTPEEAFELAKNITAQYPEAKVSAPVFVYDGESFMTAWMLKVEKEGKIISRVFVAGGGLVYERKEGEKNKNVVGFDIAFEENTSENEVRSILDSYNLILPYELNYNVTDIGPFFYITIPEEDIDIIKNNLNEKGIYPLKTSKKRNGQIIVIMDSSLPEKELIKELIPIADSYNLSLKRFIWVYIYYKDSAISLDDGNILKESLEKNETVISASLVTRKG